MKNKNWNLLIIIAVFSSQMLIAQTSLPKEFRKAHVEPGEIISMSKTMPFHQALEILNSLSKSFYNKIIIYPEDRQHPIEVDIINMHWLDALEQILGKNKMWYEEHTDYLKIIPLLEETAPAPKVVVEDDEEKKEVGFKTREVMISAIFFEADGSKMQQLGFSWDLFRGNDVNAGFNMSAAETKSGLFEINLNPNLDFGNFMAVFKSLEKNQAGEIVASPQITVRSRQEGRIQVGSDVAITIKDFAGNSVTQFFSTGSIIKVKPEVLKYDSTYYIHLNLLIERSNTSTGESGLEIKKSVAETSILLLDGEETIIGGLYINEETKSREGIPILKDMPWWFFGFRYFFGYESKNIIKKELIILINAELLPTLAERVNAKNRQQESIPILLKQRMNQVNQKTSRLK